MEWTGKMLAVAMYLIGSLMIILISIIGSIRLLAGIDTIWVTVIHGIYTIGYMYLYTYAAAFIYDTVIDPYDDTP